MRARELPLPVAPLRRERGEGRGEGQPHRKREPRSETTMRGHQPWRTNRSRVLRSQPISAEAKLWRRLRSRQLAGLKFIRQASIDPYFVDFLCREHKVVVEIDGGTRSAEAEVADDA